MLKFSPLFVQKIFCFVQIPKSFVQKHETKTAETGENDGNLRKTSNDIRRKRQQYPRKTYPKVLRILYKSIKQKQQKTEKTTAHPKRTTTISRKNDSKIREKHAQKSYGFCTKQG
jgi:hypothetical protein